MSFSSLFGSLAIGIQPSLPPADQTEAGGRARDREREGGKIAHDTHTIGRAADGPGDSRLNRADIAGQLEQAILNAEAKHAAEQHDAGGEPTGKDGASPQSLEPEGSGDTVMEQRTPNQAMLAREMADASSFRQIDATVHVPSPAESLPADAAGYITLDTAGHSGHQHVSNEYSLSALSLGRPFATTLPRSLTLADEFDRRGDRHRKRLILLTMEQELQRLRDRLAARIGALAALTRPLAAFVSMGAPGNANDRGRLAKQIRAYASSNSQFLDDFGQAIADVGEIGYDVFSALDVLSRRTHYPLELQPIRSELLDKPAAAFAIALSTRAKHAVLDRSTLENGPSMDRTSTATIEGAQRTFAALGFSRARSTLLAQAACQWHSTVLIGAGWMAQDPLHQSAERAAAFEALLKIFGAMAMSHRAEALASGNTDECAEGTARSLPFLHSLEQAV